MLGNYFHVFTEPLNFLNVPEWINRSTIRNYYRRIFNAPQCFTRKSLRAVVSGFPGLQKPRILFAVGNLSSGEFESPVLRCNRGDDINWNWQQSKDEDYTSRNPSIRPASKHVKAYTN